MLVSIGDRFGDLTILERVKYTVNGMNIKWKCRCSCGVEKEIWQGHLIHRKLISCGCKTIIGNPNNTLNERQCSTCKDVKPLNSDNFDSNASTKNGYSYQCKNCRSATQKIYRSTDTQKQKIRDYNISYNKTDKGRAVILQGNYRRVDKQNGQHNDITIEFLLGVFTQSCYSCGISEKLGLDRIDNNKGHTQDNCLPCCAPCNLNRQLFNLTSEETKIRIGPIMKLLHEAVKGDR